ncbi:MAG: three-Cys-motif partner protein TcmP [Gemmatimonadota bacterium]
MPNEAPLVPDGLYTPEIARHSLEKIRRHNYYATLFAQSMANKWRHRVYIGLYSGAGRAVLRDSGEIVETSALGVIRLDPGFTRYIFVDQSRDCISALHARIDALGLNRDVTYIREDVNRAVPQILAAIPRFTGKPGDGLLGLCFVDPFRVDLNFDVIRRLSRFRIDFLIMLPFGFDVRRNLQRYLDAREDDRLGALIDAPNWREEWRQRRESDRHFVRFALGKFDQAMARLDFRRREMRETVSVRIKGMGVYLYSLALYTRHELGAQFWRTTIAGTSSGQLGLDI